MRRLKTGGARPMEAVCVLSGGALKAVGHLGVVAAFRERDINFRHYVGCSGGALFGSLLAAGYDPRDILETLSRQGWAAFVGKSRQTMLEVVMGMARHRASGLLDTNTFAALLGEFLPQDFDALPFGLTVNAMHLRSGREVLFTGRSGPPVKADDRGLCLRQPLPSAVAASISLPVLFRPTRLKACRQCDKRSCGVPVSPEDDGWDYFIDGGFLSSLPLAPALALKPLFCLGVDIRLETPARFHSVAGWQLKDIMLRTADAIVRGQIKHALAASSGGETKVLLVAPPLWDAAFFDAGREAVERTFQIGLETGRAFFRDAGFTSGEKGSTALLSRLKDKITAYVVDDAARGRFVGKADSISAPER